jgi:hypothetical protein
MAVTLHSYLTTRKTSSVTCVDHLGVFILYTCISFHYTVCVNCHVCCLIASEIVPTYFHLVIMQCDFYVV